MCLGASPETLVMMGSGFESPVGFEGSPMDRGVSVPDQSVARKHPWTWSLTTPTFCMNAYTLVGPTKRYP
jgi:hypothetical protein